jgi:hypothetical protein
MREVRQPWEELTTERDSGFWRSLSGRGNIALTTTLSFRTLLHADGSTRLEVAA